MILVDTNIIIALLHPRDQHTRQAERDLRRFEKVRLALLPAVLAETVFFLPTPFLRQALRTWLYDAEVEILPLIECEGHFEAVFEWMQTYEDHSPDWADACLAVASSLLPKAKVWTYDREFATIWRRADGSRIPLAVR